MPPVRILHILQSLGFGGMENRIARLARGLDPKRFEVEVLVLRPSAGAEVDLGPARRHVFPIPPGLHPLRLLALARFIRRGGYDVVHTHNWSSMLYGLLAGWLARRPLLFHGEHGLNRSDLAGIPWKRLWAQRLLARLPDALVPVNDVIAAHMAEKWRLPRRSLSVIYNGVDLERFRPAAAPAGFVLGMVGRLDDVKDVGCALEALALARAEGAPEARLILVGDGPMAASLAARAAALGISDAVEFAGARRDVPDWYGRFHLYLNTSVYEGMSNTLLEAMACGLPLAVSRVPGNAAWLREGENAAFFAPGDARGLADRILALRADPGAREAMGRRNRERAVAEFDNRRFLSEYSAFYARLLPRTGLL